MESHNSLSIERNITLEDFCRLCLQQCGARQMRPLRGYSVNFGAERVSFPDMLVYICGLPSNLNDALPQRVCKTCISRLETAYLICRDFKEKETILDRFYLNGLLLERLTQYNKFRFESAESETEDITMEESMIPACEIQINENEPGQINDVFSMNVSQSGVTEEETVKATMENSVDDSLEEQSKQSVEIVSQASVLSVYSECDSNGSIKFEIEKETQPTARLKKNRSANSTQTSYPEHDGLFYCPNCPRRFSMRKHYMEHLSGHRALLEQRYKCVNCEKCFRKKDQLNRHNKNCCRRIASAVPKVRSTL